MFSDTVNKLITRSTSVFLRFCVSTERVTLNVERRWKDTLSVIDKHQHLHLTFNSILVKNVDFDVKTHKNT
jgi:hypothetical protein